MKHLQTAIISYNAKPNKIDGITEVFTSSLHRTAAAVNQALNSLNLKGVSVIYSGNSEGKEILKHFKKSSGDFYRCISVSIETSPSAFNKESILEELESEGTGTIVFLGTHEFIAKTARAVALSGIADILIMVDNAGPVPRDTFSGVRIPVIIFERDVPKILEFDGILNGYNSDFDEIKKLYLEQINGNKNFMNSGISQDPSVPGTVLSGMLFVNSLKQAQKNKCDTALGICSKLHKIDEDEWIKTIINTKFQGVTSLFKDLKNFTSNDENNPNYTLNLLENEIISKVSFFHKFMLTYFNSNNKMYQI